MFVPIRFFWVNTGDIESYDSKLQITIVAATKVILYFKVHTFFLTHSKVATQTDCVRKIDSYLAPQPD